jgi:membrane-bound serine protease (ClpP class)
MAPATNIGAATPVGVDGGDLARKMTNDAAARVRAIAARRDRPVGIAAEIVTKARSLSVDEALRLKIADIQAGSVSEVLSGLDGRSRAGVTLDLRNVEVVPVEMPWKLRLLHVLANPNVAYLLLLLAIYGLLAEFSHPGAVFPGVVGGIAALMAFYGLAVLSVNATGLLLIVLAIGLFLGDALLPGHGTLSLGGAVAFALGSVMLFPDEAGRVAPSLVFGATAVTVALFATLVTLAVRSRLRPAYSGVESARGASVEVRSDISPGGRGWVWYQGALWAAMSDAALRAGERAEIVSAEGLTLRVRPYDRS